MFMMMIIIVTLANVITNTTSITTDFQSNSVHCMIKIDCRNSTLQDISSSHVRYKVVHGWASEVYVTGPAFVHSTLKIRFVFCTSVSSVRQCAVLGRHQWPCGLRRRSAAALLLGLWVRIPPGHGYLSFVSVVC
jgi:hypothetical protein